MEENRKIILDFMSNEKYIPMKAKEMAFILGVPKEKYTEFHQILNELENECKIESTRKGKYMLIDTGIYKTGILELKPKGFGFVKVDDDEDIFIPSENVNNALNGDTVLVKLTNTTNVAKKKMKNEGEISTVAETQHKEGKIIKILKHEKNTAVGVFQNSRNFGFVVPDDKRFGTDIFISKKDFGKAKNNQKVVVRITKYPQNGRKAEGKIIEILGNKDTAGVDMLSLVKEYNLPYEFPEPVLNEARALEINITEKDLNTRLDLRNKEIFTIDGEDAKDLDDAVCVEKNEDGNYVLGVHIADVSHYVKEGSQLDKEAIIRGTSVYMMDRVIPMLPKELSNGICSLNQGEDKCALSVIMEINSKGQVVSSDIRKTIIRVTRRMSYTGVYKILQYINNIEQSVSKSNMQNINIGQSNSELTVQEIEEIMQYKDYFEHFKLMQELALILKNKRNKEGSLDLDIPESKIVLDENGVAIDVKKYEITFANEIIEQYMLIANETVAEKFYWLEAPFIYRVHNAPDMEKIRELNTFIWNLGYRIKANKDNIHPKAFAEVLEEVKGKPEERVVSNLILRTLKIAQYESENHGHFGIASKYYCHFTSPIRRYPDLFIHRVISKYIEKNYNVSEGDIEKYSEQATKYAKTSSEREKVAQKVERDSVDIKKAEYMQSRIGEEYEGIISNITQFGVFVELKNTVEGLVRFEDLGDEYFVYDEEHKQLIGEHTGLVFKIGDRMRIQVIEANKELRRISFRRVSN
ncbi:MAG: RNB domain-containing ribonuclease [Clostridia bacterium]|nr:RNB domain-containing ribonuclease [Clostridia bacterium]